LIGTNILHYEIIDKVGEGGMGVVYKARDTKLDRTVALKCLPTHTGTDETEKLRFINEAKAASALDHPNVCNIYSIEETEDGILFIVMAYYEGLSLKEKIGQGPLPLNDVANYAIQIASGLLKAHQNGIVHRDLKPANIFITNDDQIKIIDFGLAKASRHTMLTKSGTTLGTVPYMSPEQAQGGKVDHRTDIWSLGVVLYEMITGVRPFKSEYESALVYSILNEVPEPVTGLRSGVPMELERIINKCMEKDPRNRYQHTDEISIDVRRIEKDLTSDAETGNPLSRNSILHRKSKHSLVKQNLRPMIVGISIIIMVMIGSYLIIADRSIGSEVGGSIAVLPFENLSPNPDDGYFTAGIHEDIIIQLAGIDDIKVIGRSSVMGYEPGQRDYTGIGGELGVSTVLEGSVHRAGDRVRVSVNLIDTRTHQTVWAESYDRDMTDIFFIRTDIAQEISNTLQANLTPREEALIAHIPTQSTQAYDFYLQARDYTRRDYYNPNDFIRAIKLYEGAIDRDPEFALAYAGLSRAHLSMYWFAFDQTDARLERSQDALERAMEIDPDHPEVRMARGIFYYSGFRDYKQALNEFTFVKEMMPNDADIYFYIGAVQRRLGLWDDAVLNFELSLERDPRNIIRIYEMIMTYQNVREYEKARKVLEQAELLFPDSDSVKQIRYALMLRKGNIEYTRQHVLDLFPDIFADDLLGMFYLYFKRDFKYILDNTVGSTGLVMDSQRWYYPKSLFLGFVYNAVDNDEAALETFDIARTELEKARDQNPDDPRIRNALGLAYAGLEMKEEAIREGKKAMDLLPISEDAISGPDFEIGMAKIYTMLGEYDLALDYIERLLSIPADFISPGMLRVDPDWDPLRGNPRFQKIIGEVEIKI